MHPHTSPEQRQRQPKEISVSEEPWRAGGTPCKGPSHQEKTRRLGGLGFGAGQGTQALSGPREMPGRGSEEGEGTRRSFWGDPLPVISSTQKPGTEASLSSKAAQHRRRKRTRCQPRFLTGPKFFPIPFLFPCGPHPRSPERSVGGRKRGSSAVRSSEGQLFYAAVGGSGGCGGFDLIQAPK